MAASLVARFSATVIDETGIKANTSVHLFIDPASTAAQITTALNAWISALDGVTGGQVVRSEAVILPALPGGIKSSPVSGSEVQEVATFDFSATGTPYKWASVVPSFLESLETGDHKPDLAAGAVSAYTGLLTTAPVLGGAYTNMGNDALVALVYAFLATRKHRRAQRAVSFVEA